MDRKFLSSSVYCSNFSTSCIFYAGGDNMSLMNFFENGPAGSGVLLYILFAWSLLWKGLSLWHSSKNDQRNWFIVLLVLNTVGLLDIVYLFKFAKKKMKIQDLMFWEKTAK